MSKIHTGGPAFPVSTRPLESEHGYGHQDGASTWQFGGMTLRDYFAAKAMQGFLSEYVHGTTKDIAELSYRMADAMLATREKSE